MKLHVKNAGLALYSSLLLAACQKETSKNTTAAEELSPANSRSEPKLKNDELELNITGLENLGPNARYEGWVIIKGAPVSTGVFTVNNSGQMSQNIFEVPATQDKLKNATAFVLTIEPYPDNSPAPSDQHLLAGNFNVNTASLSINHPAALNTHFSSATGYFLLATPATATMTDELSGIWFINAMGGSPAAGLNLPALPVGWRYEGWALISGQPVSTGAFMNGNMADNAAPFSGPPFPGEDFITMHRRV